MEVPTGNIFGTGGGFSGVSRSSGLEHEVPSPPAFGQAPRMDLAPPSAGPGLGVSHGDCHYFLQGTCSKGDNCHFRHSAAAKASGTVCRFWQNGFCKDDENCSFRHPASGGRGHPRPGPTGRFGGGRGVGGGRGGFAAGRGSSRLSWDMGDRRKQACVFFAQGKCTKGDMCPFSHATPDAAAVGGVPSSAHTSEVSEACPPSNAEPKAENNAANSYLTSQPSQLYSSAPPGNRLPQQHGAFGTSPFAGGRHAAPPLVKGRDGVTYVIGPDGLVPFEVVARTVGAGHGNEDSPPVTKPTMPVTGQTNVFDGTAGHASERERLAREAATDSGVQAALRPSERAPTQGGVIALPDGGFITRKRAAELQLRNNYGEKQVRHSRQREAREQDEIPDNRSGRTEGMSVATGSTRGSILDRLGPARPMQNLTATPPKMTGLPSLAQPVQGSAAAAGGTVGAGRLGQARIQAADRRVNLQAHTRSTQETAPVVERTAAPATNRHDVSSRLGAKREEKRLHSSSPPVKKIAPPTSTASAFAMLHALGTTRQTKHLDGSQEGGPRKGLSASLAKSPSNSLNFTIPTLEEIKKRKARSGKGTSATVLTSPQESNRGNGLSPMVKTPRASLEAEKPAPILDANESVGFTEPVRPSPEAASPPSVPQLDAADLDEFSEWL